MLSWGPDIHSFEAISMNFGYFVQYTSPLNRHYWYFVISPSGPASGRRCRKMEFWGLSINSFEAFNMNFGVFCSIYYPFEKTLLVSFDITLRVAKPWIKVNPCYDEAHLPPLSAKVSFVGIDAADWKLPGNNQSMSNSVFSVSSYILVC